KSARVVSLMSPHSQTSLSGSSTLSLANRRSTDNISDNCTDNADLSPAHQVVSRQRSRISAITRISHGFRWSPTLQKSHPMARDHHTHGNRSPDLPTEPGECLVHQQGRKSDDT